MLVEPEAHASGSNVKLLKAPAKAVRLRDVPKSSGRAPARLFAPRMIEPALLSPAGIVPVSWFRSTIMSQRLEALAKEPGKVPDRLLFRKSKLRRRLLLGIASGKGPVRLLLPMYMTVRPGELRRHRGIVPFSPMLFSIRTVRLP